MAPERTLPGLSPKLRTRLRRLFRALGAVSPTLAARVALRMLLTPLAHRPGAEDDRFHATARRQRLPTRYGGLEAYVWDGDGPTVLIVHGWISHSGRFAELVEALRQRGMRVVAFDAPAHGRSGGRRADLPAFRTAIEAVATRFGPVHAVLAHSFGALSTAAWLAATPLPTLRAAVLVGMMRDAAYLIDSFRLAMQLDSRVAARLEALLERRYGAPMAQFSAQAMAAHIRVPVLLVHGEADELVPSAHATEIAEQLLDGQVLIVPGQRHSEPLRDASTIAVMVGFLARHLEPHAGPLRSGA